MGFLKHLRSKSRIKEEQDNARQFNIPIRYGRDLTARLPENVLEKIMIEVCPHTQDHTYLPSEQSAIGDGCMLCDLRDLAATAQVCRRWYRQAQDLLYSSVRIDAVHYCELEEVLAEKRKRKSFLKHSVEAGDIPTIRLSLFCRTVRESPVLASRILLLKLPYMTRETSKGELARTVAVLPNLQYVDLPDGLSTGDPSCHTLMHELQARCPDIRKMSYSGGSEPALELLAQRHWHNLEILELSSLSVEPSTLRIVLASLPTLHQLTISDIPWLDDTIFQSSPALPEFPPLQALSFENTPNLTAEGLRIYLSHPQNRENFSSLVLDGTGVAVPELHTFLMEASNLTSLKISETVTRSIALSLTDLPPLTSISLRTLHFEIIDSDDAHGLQKPAASYYTYLARSLINNNLPALRKLYVRDPDFPESLLLPPPAVFASYSSTPSQPPRGFAQTLEVFSKGLDELDWVFTSIAPPAPGARQSVASGGRPLSSYSASRGLGPQWAMGGEVRKSVVVGNGFGGFLAVPAEEMPRPGTAGSERSLGSGTIGHGFGHGVRAASIGSLSPSMGSGEDRSSLLRPPPSLTGSVGSAGTAGKGKRASRHDLWR